MLMLLQRPRFLAVLTVLAVLIAGSVHLAVAASRARAQPAASTAAMVPMAVPAIITAARPLPPGHLLGPDDLARLAWPAGPLPPGSIAANSPAAAALLGARTRRSLGAGEWLQAGAVVAAGERGVLAAVVPPGHRAIAIAVDATTSASGLIWPGDRVDVILTQEFRDDRLPAAQRVLAETILADVRILSADQRLRPAAAAADPPGVPTTVTLAVTPEQAQRLAVASTLGRLHLALRGAGAAAETAPPQSWAGMVSPGLQRLRQPAAAAVPMRMPAAPAAGGADGATGLTHDAVPVFRGSAGVLK